MKPVNRFFADDESAPKSMERKLYRVSQKRYTGVKSNCLAAREDKWVKLVLFVRQYFN